MIEVTPRNGSVAARNIKIIGIGGAGANALDRMALDGVSPSCLIAANTEAQALVASVAGEKIQFGVQSTRGLGAGGDPELGRCAAEEAVGEIRSALEGAEAVFILAGLGGGTGSGAAPLVAELARESGALVIALVTLPFNFEGKRRAAQAADALAYLQHHADAVLCFENDRMGDAVPPKAGVQTAFAAADLTLSQCVLALAGLLNRTGLIHLGFDDLAAVLQSVNARCLFGYGEAEGGNRAYDALARALKNPLMDKGRMLRDCATVLVQVTGGPDLTLDEVQLLMEEFNRHVDDRTRICFGAAVDPDLSGRVTVTIISSIGDEQPAAASPRPISAPERVAPVPAVIPQLPPQAPVISVVAEPQEEPAEEDFAPEAETDFQPEISETVEEERAEVETDFQSEVEETPEPQEEIVAEAEEPPVVQAPLPAPRIEKPRGLRAATSQASLFGDEEPTAPTEKELPLEAPIARPVPGRMLRRPYPERPAVPQPVPVIEPAPVAEAAPEPLPEPDLVEEAPVQPETEPVIVQAPEPELTSAAEPVQMQEPAPEQTPEPVEPKAATRPVFVPRIDRRPLPPRQPRSPELIPAAETATPPPSAPAPATKAAQQEVLQFEPVTRGRFEKSEPTIVDGQDLDVPTYMRRRVKLR